MPVAPSFQAENFKRLSAEPFYKNGKAYITIENTNTGNKRDVRWYSDAEYAKAYGKKDEGDGGFDGLKHARGFDNGPILVIRGNRPSDEPWLRASIARYAMGVGWHFVSTDTLPDDIPSNFKFVLLGWKEATIDDRHMKKPEALSAIITQKVRNKDFVRFKDES